jgi:hypothetical protein
MLDPVLINPDAVYDDGSLHVALGLTDATLAAARRAGTLRYARRGKRVLYLGRWILAWLDMTATTQPAAPRSEEVCV